MARLCPSCHQPADESRNFCVHCGTPLQKPAAAPRHIVIPRSALYATAFILLLVLAAGLVFFMGSVNVDSDPQGAGVYIDSVYKGTTPSEIRFLLPGKHRIEFRHTGYPDWTKDFDYSPGQTLAISADLSDNIIPEVIAVCSTPGRNVTVDRTTGCRYGQGDLIVISGTAVRPHPDQYPEVSLHLYNMTTNQVDLVITAPINADNTFQADFDSSSLASGSYIFSVRIGELGGYTSVPFSVESPDATTRRVLQEIVEDYHKIHSYSEYDLFVCSDMAMDVWNIVTTRGIKAILAAGKVDAPTADWKDYDHAWVLAEVAPKQWIALETTGGILVTRDENPLYYRGIFFENPKELKTNMDLRRDYNNEISDSSVVVSQYNTKLASYKSELAVYQAMVDSYNQQYAGRSLTYSEYQDAQEMKATISEEENKLSLMKAELDLLYADFTSQDEKLKDIVAQMQAQADKGSSLMDT